jgi:hypothetical protein
MRGGAALQVTGALVSRGICNLPAWMVQSEGSAASAVPLAADEQQLPPSPIRIRPPPIRQI